MTILFLIITINIISFVLGFYYKTKYIYIITRHMGLTSEIVYICFNKKQAFKASKKIKALNQHYTICVTKYCTLIHLNNRRKCDKKYVEGIYKI